MANVIEQLENDAAEVANLLDVAKRPRIQNLLVKEKENILAEIKQREIKKKAADQQEKQPPKSIQTTTITNYAWDQSEKFVKIYVSSNLTGIEKINEEQVSISSGDESHYQMTIQNFKGKNYIFNVPKLLHPVQNPLIKIKKDMILIMLKKASAQKWEHLTAKDKVKDEEKKKDMDSAMDKNADPSASIMNMMKKMYNEGDDDMKRTIAKAWTESRDKQGTGPGAGMGM